jgi:GNAT superfamily N-acetyltransferase
VFIQSLLAHPVAMAPPLPATPLPPSSTPLLVAELPAAHRDDIVAHLLELDAGDRRMRFGLTIGDDGVRRYVRSIDFKRDATLGVFDPLGRLIGFGHLGLSTHGPAEFGLSVRRAERLRGIGSQMLQRAAGIAAANGHRSLLMTYLPGNVALARLALRAGMRLTPGPEEPTAILALPAAPPGAMLQLALAEAVNTLDLGFRRLAGQADAEAAPG